MTVRYRADETDRIQTPAVKDGSLAALTGLTTVVISIQRISDGQWYDFNDDTFKAAGWTTRQQQMTEVSATLAPGEYYYDWDPGNITNPTTDETYMVRVDETGGTAKNTPFHGEMKYELWVDELFDQIASRAAPGDAMTLTPTERSTLAFSVDSQLTSNHGSGDWITATGFATPGDAMGLTAAAVDLILDEPLAGHTTAGTLGWQAILTNYNDGERVAVHYDFTNGSPGTVLGVNGTPDNPSNNEADMRAIANALGITATAVRGGELWLAQTYREWYFYGGEGGGTVYLNGQDVAGSVFWQVGVYGAMSNFAGFDIVCRFCIVGPITDASGEFHECLILDGLTPAAGAGLVLRDCTNWRYRSTPVVFDFVNGSPNVRCHRFAGRAQLVNATDPSDLFDFTGLGAELEIAASCTAGTADVAGQTKLTDNGTMTVNTDALADEIVDVTLSGTHGAGSWEGGADPTVATRVQEIWQRLHLDPANPREDTPTSIKIPADGSVIDIVLDVVGNTVTGTRQP
jgi:hypothetical protein